MTIPGIGLVLGIAIYGKIGDVSRFGRPEKLCAYAVIVPFVRNPAGTVRHGRMTGRGSGVLRWAAVEAVQSRMTYCPESDISGFYRRPARGGLRREGKGGSGPQDARRDTPHAGRAR